VPLVVRTDRRKQSLFRSPEFRSPEGEGREGERAIHRAACRAREPASRTQPKQRSCTRNASEISVCEGTKCSGEDEKTDFNAGVDSRVAAELLGTTRKRAVLPLETFDCTLSCSLLLSMRKSIHRFNCLWDFVALAAPCAVLLRPNPSTRG